MTQIRLTSLSNKQHHQVIEVGTDAKEHLVLEEWQYQIEDTYITRTEVIMHTRACLLYTSRCV